jgi:hypothetical protein
MMVPVFYDVLRKKTKVWAFLGWVERPLTVSFATPPQVTVRDADGQEVPRSSYRLSYSQRWVTLAYPVTAEVYVSRVLDRQEFRKHCDRHVTRKAILENLH